MRCADPAAAAVGGLDVSTPVTDRTSDASLHRANELDALACVLPADRHETLAALLTDEDVAPLKHLVEEGMGANTLRALAWTWATWRPGRSPRPVFPSPGRLLKVWPLNSWLIICGIRRSARQILLTIFRNRSPIA
jgi:hypothetical protein